MPLLALSGAAAQDCRKWSPAAVVGRLDPKLLREASGLAASRQFADRLYHVNDSGNGPFVFVTDLSGGELRAIRVDGLESSSDVEDLALGPCFADRSCLFLADIGDNRAARTKLAIFLVEEREDFGERVPITRRIEIAYPDGARDAEGFAVHPNGDLYVLTKKADYRRGHAFPARLFRLARERWDGGEKGVHQLEPWGEIDLPALADGGDVFSKLATAMDIRPDARTLLILTYRDAFELLVDVSAGPLASTRQLIEEDRIRRIALTRLPQQESAGYLSTGSSILYTSERVTWPTSLMRVDCLD